MTHSKNSTTDFAGFIDGFQAQNLASIQRSIALQLSEMQTRLAVICGLIDSGDEFAKRFSEIASTFHDESGNIVDRLVTLGKRLNDLLLRDGERIVANDPIHTQTRGLIRAFVEAAEASRNDRLIDAAVTVAQSYGELSAAATA
jgi:hypothetical protein